MAPQLFELPSAAVAVLDIRRRDDQRPQQPKRIDHDVPFAADHLFPPS
jgi:hypothetical protein